MLTSRENDPLIRYQQAMGRIHAPADLPSRVTERARSPKRSSPPPAPNTQNRPAACIALALTIGGATLSGTFGQNAGQNLSFAVKAYGSSEETLLPRHENDMIAFNCETETQRLVDSDADVYSEEGFFTGCTFSMEGEGIKRIQAHLSSGELYRIDSFAYSAEENPALAEEASCWKPAKRGEGELLGTYDYVAAVPFYETVYPDGENAYKLRGDPGATEKINCYKRLGQTIDVNAEDWSEEDVDLTACTFGLWTNAPYEGLGTEHRPANDPKSLDAALDTLDSSQLTITVTFADGGAATQTIALHAADFKGNRVTVVNGLSTVVELVPQIVSGDDALYREQAASPSSDSAVIHTLYGTVESETAAPFPFGEASRAPEELEKPLTAARKLGNTSASPGQEAEAVERPTITCGTDVAKDDVTDQAVFSQKAQVVDDPEHAYQTNVVAAGDAGFVWRNGHEAPGWDLHALFQIMEPFQERSFTLVYVVPDEALEDPDLALLYKTEDWQTRALRTGPLL